MHEKLPSLLVNSIDNRANLYENTSYLVCLVTYLGTSQINRQSYQRWEQRLFD